jgi:hypothetical protein
MSLTLPFASRQADLLQRALEGRLPPADLSPTIGGYADVAGRLGDLMPRAALVPDPAYRAELHARLVTLATTAVQDRPVRPGRPADGRSADTRQSWWAGWRRTAAAVTAATVALMLGVGFASASALPGGLLYPVKQLIQNAQVNLAHGDLARGKVLLHQAGGHIADASTLVGQGDPDPADIDSALRSAASDLGTADRALLAQYAQSHDPTALTALSKFATTQSPLLGQLRGRVPVVSVPLVDSLLAQLGQAATAVKHVVAQCGSPCASVPVVNLPGPSGLVGTPGQGAAGSTGGLPGSGGSGGLSGLGGLLGPGGITGGAGSGGTAGSGGPAGTGASVGATVGSGGATVNLPGVGATVPAPKVSAGSGGVAVTVPKATATVGKIKVTLPGVGVTLPGAKSSTSGGKAGSGGQAGSGGGSGSSPSPSSVCVLVICLG